MILAPEPVVVQAYSFPQRKPQNHAANPPIADGQPFEPAILRRMSEPDHVAVMRTTRGGERMPGSSAGCRAYITFSTARRHCGKGLALAQSFCQAGKASHSQQRARQEYSSNPSSNSIVKLPHPLLRWL